jgi:FKBP-type peptidyl-prolyl cis-trans isomerase (trigger factor)
MTIEKSIDYMYKETLKKEKVLPVAEAEIKEIISQDPLKIRIHIEVFPEIIVDKKYKNIKLKKQEIKVSSKEVENALGDIQIKFTKFEKIIDNKFKVKLGDKVTIDTDGYDIK